MMSPYTLNPHCTNYNRKEIGKLDKVSWAIIPSIAHIKCVLMQRAQRKGLTDLGKACRIKGWGKLWELGKLAWASRFSCA